MKILHLIFILVFCINISATNQAQDSLYIKNFKDKYETVFNKSNSESPDEKLKSWSNFKAYIKLEKKKFEKETKSYNILDSIEEHVIVEMTNKAFFQLGKHDSIFFYQDYLNKKSKNYFLLSKVETLTTWLKALKLDYVGAIKGYEKTLEFLEKSKNPERFKQKIYTLFGLTQIYMISDNLFLCNNMFLILDDELEKIKNEPYYDAILIDYQLLKCTLLTKEEKFIKSIELAKQISSNKISNPYLLERYHFMMLENYIVNKMPDEALTHYKILFNTEDFFDTKTYEKDVYRYVYKARILLLKGELGKIKKYVDLIEKKPLKDKQKKFNSILGSN